LLLGEIFKQQIFRVVILEEIKQLGKILNRAYLAYSLSIYNEMR